MYLFTSGSEKQDINNSHTNNRWLFALVRIYARLPLSYLANVYA